MIDIGTGPPLVLVPGLQGRWEWMRPAVEALAERFRVLTFSLAGEKDSDIALPRDGGFDTYVRQIDAVLDRAGASSAIICGVSFGALIAFRYATLRGRSRAATHPRVTGATRFRAQGALQTVQPSAATMLSAVLCRFGTSRHARMARGLPKMDRTPATGDSCRQARHHCSGIAGIDGTARRVDARREFLRCRIRRRTDADPDRRESASIELCRQS